MSTNVLQELHLCVDGKVWKWSEPFDINSVGSVVRVMKTFNQQQSLIITIKQITNVQKQVREQSNMQKLHDGRSFE